MPDIDSLNIEIQGDNSKAIESINKLESRLASFAKTLSSFTNLGTYSDGVNKLSTAFTNLDNILRTIDVKQVKDFSSALRSLAGASNSLNKASSADWVSEVSEESKKAKTKVQDLTQTMIKDYGLKGTKGATELRNAITDLNTAIASGQATDAAKRNIEEIIEMYGRFDSALDDTQRKLLEEVSAINSSGRKIRFNDYFREEFQDQYKLMQETFGKGFGISVKGGTEFDTWVNGSEILSQITNQTDDLRDKFEILYQQIREARKAMEWDNYVNTTMYAVEKLEYDVDQLEDALKGTRLEAEKASVAFKDIWNSEGYENTRQYLKDNRTEIVGTEEEVKKLTALTDNLFNFTTKADGVAESVQGLAQIFNIIDFDSAENLNDTQIIELASALNGAAVSSEQLAKAGYEVARSQQQVNNSSEGFIKIVDTMHQLEGVQIPNFDSLKSLASAMRTMSDPKITTGLDNLPKIANELTSFENINIPDLGAYKDLTASLRSLGSKSVVRAADTLPKIYPALEKISHIKVDNVAGVAELAQSLSLFGRAASVKAADNIPKIAIAFNRLVRSAKELGSVDRSLVEFTKAMADLASTHTRLNDTTKKLSPQMGKLNTHLKRGKGLTTSLASAIGKLYAAYWALFRVIGLVRKSIDLSSDLTETQNVVDTAFGDYNKKIEDLAKVSVQDYGMSELEAKKMASRWMAMASAMGIAGDKASDMAIEMTKLTADMGSFFNYDYADVAEKMDSIFTGQTRPLRAFGLDLTQATLKEWALAQGMEVNIKTMTQAEKAMLRYQYVLANTTNAQGDFARTADTWANSIRILKEQFKQFGTILGTGFINFLKPMVQSFSNAMNTIIKLTEKALNAIGKLMGWQIEISPVGVANEMESVSESVDDVGDSLGGAADKAKKLKNQLLSLDELNVLTTDKGSGSGGGGGASGGGAGIGNADVKGGEAIIKKYASDINSWWELGFRISDKLADAMEDIDWNDIKRKAREIARNIADLLNGFIDNERFWIDIGHTIAQGLNTALEFADAFITNLHWEQLGKDIGLLINQAVKEFDWYLLGKTIADGLNGITDFFYGWGKEMDFSALGEGMAEALNQFFIHWNSKKLAQTISIWVKGLLDTIIAFLEKANWHLIGEKIGDFLANLDFMGIAEKVGRALFAALNAAINLWAGAYKKAPFETLLLTLVGINKLIKSQMFIKLAKGIKDVIGNFKLFASAALGGNTAIAALTASQQKFWKAGSLINQMLIAYDDALMLGSTHTQAFGAALTAAGEKLTLFQKALLGVAGLAAEFLIFKEIGKIIYDFVNDANTSIGELIIKLGLLSAAATACGMAIYAAFGPVGVVIAAAVAAIGLAVGADMEAQEKLAEQAALTAQGIEDSYTKAFSRVRESSKDLDSITQEFKDLADSATSDAQRMHDKFKELDDIQPTIQECCQTIESIGMSAKVSGNLTDSELDTIKNAYSTLRDTIKKYIEEIYDYLIQQEMADYAVLKKSGKLTAAQQKDYEERIAELYKLRDAKLNQVDSTVKAVEKETKNYEEAVKKYGRNSKKANEALTKLMKAYTDLNDLAGKTGGMDEMASKMEEAAQKISDASSKVVTSLDFSKDGIQNLDDAKRVLGNSLDSLADTYSKAKDDLKTNLDEYAKVLKGEGFTDVEIAAKIEEKSKVDQERLGVVKEAYVQKLQEMSQGIVGEIGNVAQAAYEEWMKLGGAEGTGKSKEEFVNEAVSRYKTEIIDPYSAQIEGQIRQMGGTVGQTASQAAQGIIDNMWTTVTYDDGSESVVLATSIQSMLESAVGKVDYSIPGKKLNEDFGSMLKKAVESTKDDAEIEAMIKKSAEDYAKLFADNMDPKVIEDSARIQAQQGSAAFSDDYKKKVNDEVNNPDNYKLQDPANVYKNLKPNEQFKAPIIEEYKKFGQESASKHAEGLQEKDNGTDEKINKALSPSEEVKKTVKEEYSNLGKDASDGYAESFSKQENLSKIEADAAKLPEAGMKGVKEAQKSNSPSKEFESLGNDAVDGYINAFSSDDASSKTKEAIKTWITNSIDGIGDLFKDTDYTEAVTALNESISKPIEEFWEIDGETSAKAISYGKAIITGISTGFTDDEVVTTITTAMDTLVTAITKYFEGEDEVSAPLSETAFNKRAKTAIQAFADSIKTNYNLVEEPVKAWVDDITETFVGAEAEEGKINQGIFEIYAQNIVDGFNAGVENNYTMSEAPMSAWAADVNNTFTSEVNADKFRDYGADIVRGFVSGIENNRSLVSQAMRELGQLANEEFAKIQQIHSPSKLYEQYAKYDIEGFNLGIERNMGSTKEVMDEWAESFSNFDPDYDFNRPSIDVSGAQDLVDSKTKDVKLDENSMQRVIINAVETAVAATLMPQLSDIRDNTAETAAKDFSIDSKDTFNAVRREANQYYARTGNAAFDF